MSSILFESFTEWQAHCASSGEPLHIVPLRYEESEKGRGEAEVYAGLEKAYGVMCDAIATGLKEDMRSRSGMVNNSGKRVYGHTQAVLSRPFQVLVARALAAKEVNSCMGRVVAAPTAGASGILPAVLYTLEKEHDLPRQKILEGMLVASGIGLIIEKKASVAGSVGGCQAETGSAAAMGAGAIVYCLGGGVEAVFHAVGITVQCMLGLVCDPVAGLVEVPCIVRNASAAAIAFSSAQIALAGVSGVIPVDECVEAMGEIGQSMERRYKETAEGGLAATRTGKALAAKIFGRPAASSAGADKNTSS